MNLSVTHEGIEWHVSFPFNAGHSYNFSFEGGAFAVLLSLMDEDAFESLVSGIAAMNPHLLMVAKECGYGDDGHFADYAPALHLAFSKI